MCSNRAQSELVGVVILVGVVVTLVSIVSIVVLSDVTEERPPVADLRVEGDNTLLRITHFGGDQLAINDLTVVVRGDDRTARFAIDSTNLTGGNGDDQFEFGETLVREHGFGGAEPRVLVIHRPTNEVISEATVSLTGEG